MTDLSRLLADCFWPPTAGAFRPPTADYFADLHRQITEHQEAMAAAVFEATREDRRGLLRRSPAPLGEVTARFEGNHCILGVDVEPDVLVRVPVHDVGRTTWGPDRWPRPESQGAARRPHLGRVPGVSRVLVDEIMLGSAVRYALGRATYIVAATCDEVRRCWPELEINTREVIRRDVEEHLATVAVVAPMDIDVESWTALAALWRPSP